MMKLVCVHSCVYVWASAHAQVCLCAHRVYACVHMNMCVMCVSVYIYVPLVWTCVCTHVGLLVCIELHVWGAHVWHLVNSQFCLRCP